MKWGVEGGENSFSRVPVGQGFIFLPRKGVVAFFVKAVGATGVEWSGLCVERPLRGMGGGSEAMERVFGSAGTSAVGGCAADRN